MSRAKVLPPPDSRAALAALYLRVAETLHQSAVLAEQHAKRCRDNGWHQQAAIEFERARRTRIAARRGRDLGLRLGAPDHAEELSD